MMLFIQKITKIPYSVISALAQLPRRPSILLCFIVFILSPGAYACSPIHDSYGAQLVVSPIFGRGTVFKHVYFNHPK